ncbi:MAG TPA: DUF4349 domain-containing protein [Thermoanaerobaculia bacterium]|nr:DUF4349 domain-containing protein [Thermoanaerobaculia bacterium]
MKRPRLLPLLVAAGVVAAALGGSFLKQRVRRETWAAARALPESAATRPALMQTASALASSVRTDSETQTPPGDALEGMFAARKLIRTASVTLEVTRYAEAAARVEAIASAHGGYVADAAVARDPGDRDRGTLTLRVRADRFDQALRALEALGKVESANLETRDVGKEYMDLETRLSAKQDAEARLRELLRTKTARLSDVIAAEKELSRVIEERELLEGERRYYDRQVALSTITAEIHEPRAFLRESALSPLTEAFARALPLLSSSVATLVYAFAAVLPWALLALLVWRLVRRLRIRRLVRVAMER